MIQKFRLRLDINFVEQKCSEHRVFEKSLTPWWMAAFWLKAMT